MSNETNNANEVSQKNEVFENSQQRAAEQSASIQENIQGVVSNCKKLNVRKEAQKRADNVLCIVSAGDVLTIEKDRSTNAWFYVTTADGISGYCMKEFVAVEQ